MPNLTANLVPTWPILAPLGPSWRQHRLQEASQWSSTGGLDRICGHLGAKRAPKSSTPQKWRSFSRKIVKKLYFQNKNEPQGILNRIRRIHRKRNIQSRTDPGFPTPGARMTVVKQTPSNYLIPGKESQRKSGHVGTKIIENGLFGVKV